MQRPSCPAPRPKTAAAVFERQNLLKQGSRRHGILGQDPRGGSIPTVVFTSEKLHVSVGGAAAFYSAVLSCVPLHPVTVRPTNTPPGLRVSPSLHVFTRNDWQTPRIFRIAAAGNAMVDDHSGSLATRDPHRTQAIEHVSNSMDARFQSPRVLLVPPTVCVQVNTRLGCCVYTCGQAVGSNPKGVAVSSKAPTSYHEFIEVELRADDTVGRKALVARSATLEQDGQDTGSGRSVRSPSMASIAAMTAVEAANEATTRAAGMLQRRCTRRGFTNVHAAFIGANPGAKLTNAETQGGNDSNGFFAYSANGTLTQEATTNTIVKVSARALHTELLFKGGALVSLGKLMDIDFSVPESACTATPASLDGTTGTDAALSRMLVDVACGDNHVVAITEQGYLLTWGNACDGRLGHGLPAETSSAETINDSDQQVVNAPASFSAAVREPQVIHSLLHKRVIHVSCGARHSLALAEDGDVFSWGHGARGALGHGDLESVDAPKSIEALRDQRVMRIACGDMHTAVLLASGVLLTCGWSEHGRLGRAYRSTTHSPDISKSARPSVSRRYNDDSESNDWHSSYSPSLLPVDLPNSPQDQTQTELCTFVTCGAAHTLLLTSKHRVLAFGWNVNGQLGVGDCRSRWTPTEVCYFGPSYVVSTLAAGKLHSLAALSDGRLFAWGSDELGQCGVGSFPQIYTIPHLVTSMVGLHVTQVVAADGHSVILTLGAQRHLDALEASHPQQYAELAEWFEAAVKEDEARRAFVFSRARDKRLRHEAKARQRKPMDEASFDSSELRSLPSKSSIAVAMATSGSYASLAKVLATQSRVDKQMAAFDRLGGCTALDNIQERPRSAACVSRPAQAWKADHADQDPGCCSDELDVRKEVRSKLSRPRTADARRAIRCSSASLWRRSRLHTLEPDARPSASTSAEKRPMSRCGSRPSTASRFNKQERAQLGVLLDGQRGDEVGSNAKQQTLVTTPDRSGSFRLEDVVAMEQARNAASFPPTRPTSAPSRARATRAS